MMNWTGKRIAAFLLLTVMILSLTVACSKENQVRNKLTANNWYKKQNSDSADLWIFYKNGLVDRGQYRRHYGGTGTQWESGKYTINTDKEKIEITLYNGDKYSFPYKIEGSSFTLSSWEPTNRTDPH